MKAASRLDLQISGIGNAVGGDYHHVNIEGVCKVAGSINCNVFSSSGMVRARHHIQAEGKEGLHAGDIETQHQHNR